MAAIAFVGMLFKIQKIQVFLVFQQETGGLPQGIGSQLPHTQGIQGSGPIQCLRNGGFLEDRFVIPQVMHSQGHLGAEPVIHMGKLRS